MNRLLLILILFFIAPVCAFAQAGVEPVSPLIVKLLQWMEGEVWAQYVFALFGVFKAISIILPSSWRGHKYYNYAMKIINAGALHVGRAKNADDLPLAVANKKE